MKLRSRNNKLFVNKYCSFSEKKYMLFFVRKNTSFNFLIYIYTITHTQHSTSKNILTYQRRS